MSGVILLEAAYYRANQQGQLFDDLSPYVSAGSLTMNADTIPIFSLNLTMRRADLLTRYVDWIAPEITLSYADGTRTTEPLGLYRVTKPAPVYTTGGVQVSYQCDDVLASIARSRISISYTIPANADPMQYIHDNLTWIGFADAQIALPTTTKRTTAARTYDPGTSRIDILSELANGAGFRNVWGNRYRRITTSPYVNLPNVAPVATYDNADAPHKRSMLVTPVHEDPDDSRLCNMVTVRKITPGQAPIYYTAMDNDPASPLYINGPAGMLAHDPIDDPQLVSQADAQAKAEYQLSIGKSYYRKLTIATLPDPFFDVGDVVGVTFTGPDGTTEIDGTWWRTGLTLPLTAASFSQGMTMNLNRTELFT